MAKQELETPRIATAAKQNPGSEIVLPLHEKLRWLLGIWGSCMIYAVLRYNVFQSVEWEHVPLFILNKSISFAGLTFIAASYLVGKWIPVYSADVKRRRSLAKFLGMSGFYFIGLHVFTVMTMLSPAYYAKFFLEDGRFNLTGEVTMLFGVLGLSFLLFPAITTLPHMYDALGGQRWQAAQRMGYWTLVMACGHLFVMGYSGWLTPGAWPKGMPPITLLAFLIALTAISAKAIASLRK